MNKFLLQFFFIFILFSFILNKSQKNAETKGVIHFLNVGSSDCMLLESKGHYGLVDTSNNYLYSEHEVEKIVIDPSKGEKDQGSEYPYNSVQRVVDYLNAKGVKILDFIIATHSHNDHIGGVPAIAYYFVNESTYYYYKEFKETQEKETTDWANHAYFVAAYNSMKIKKAKMVDVTGKSISFNLGDLLIQLLTTEPRDCYYKGENCYSITQLITAGNNRIFLGADLQNDVDNEVKGKVGKIDVYKLGHHAYCCAASYELISTIRPKDCVITNDHIPPNGPVKISYMENTLGTNVYLTLNAGEETENAAIRLNIYEEGYELENTGKQVDVTDVTGWKDWCDHMFYLEKGKILTKWQKLILEEKEYTFYFNEEGIMLYGWQKLEWKGGNDTFYFNLEKGYMLVGFQDLEWEGGKDTFYFDPIDGYMLRNCCRVIEGKEYCFDENGVLIKDKIYFLTK